MCYSVCWRPWKGELVLLAALEVPETLEVPEVIRCVLLCMLEAVEG